MARHPHDTKRPESKAVVAALEADDIEALKNALAPRQLSFCNEYVVDFNATAAAARCGYSLKTAQQQASLLMRHKGIRRYLEHLQASKAAKITSIDPDYVIQKVTEIVTKAEAKDGDKLRGLELLARHLGMFVDRTEISGPDGGPLKHEEVQNEADAFQRRIAGIAKRARTDGDTLKSVSGSEG